MVLTHALPGRQPHRPVCDPSLTLAIADPGLWCLLPSAALIPFEWRACQWESCWLDQALCQPLQSGNGHYCPYNPATLKEPGSHSWTQLVAGAYTPLRGIIGSSQFPSKDEIQLFKRDHIWVCSTKQALSPKGSIIWWVCVHTYMHVYVWCVCVHAHICMFTSGVCVHVYVHIYACLHISPYCWAHEEHLHPPGRWDHEAKAFEQLFSTLTCLHVRVLRQRWGAF